MKLMEYLVCDVVIFYIIMSVNLVIILCNVLHFIMEKRQEVTTPSYCWYMCFRAILFIVNFAAGLNPGFIFVVLF